MCECPAFMHEPEIVAALILLTRLSEESLSFSDSSGPTSGLLEARVSIAVTFRERDGMAPLKLTSASRTSVLRGMGAGAGELADAGEASRPAPRGLAGVDLSVSAITTLQGRGSRFLGGESRWCLGRFNETRSGITQADGEYFKWRLDTVIERGARPILNDHDGLRAG